MDRGWGRAGGPSPAQDQDTLEEREHDDERIVRDGRRARRHDDRRAAIGAEALKAGAIGLEELRAAHRLRDPRSALDVLVTLACFIAVPTLFGLYRAWWTAPLLVLCAIRNFHCAAQLVHESDHGTLFENGFLNRAVGNAFAYLLGYTRSGHRNAQMDHHVYLNTDRDPDIIFSQPTGGASDMIRGLASDLLFLSAFKRLLQYSQPDRDSYSVSPWKKLTPRRLGEAVGSPTCSCTCCRS
jgi:fatty acid desaturase